MVACCCRSSFVLAGLAVGLALYAQDSAEKRTTALKEAAQAFVALLDKGEFAKATKEFDETMLKAMPPAELKKTWEKVLAQAGAYKKQAESRLETKGKYSLPRAFPQQCDRTSLEGLGRLETNYGHAA